MPTSSPLNLKIDVEKTHDTLTITWDPPPSNKIHGTLLSYKITAKSISISNVRRVEVIEHNVLSVHGTLKTATVNKLEAFNEYMLMIQAVNEFGEGPSAEIVGG